MSIMPRFLATGIGSMPFDDPDHAVDVSLAKMSEAPFWPQLPRLGFKEQMNTQYIEGLPCVVINCEKNRIYFNTSGDYSGPLTQFYDAYLRTMDADTTLT